MVLGCLQKALPLVVVDHVVGLPAQALSVRARLRARPSLLFAALLAALQKGRHPRLGDAVLAAQKAYADSGAFPELLDAYHLFGDPGTSIH